jgi:hypothetical protein
MSRATLRVIGIEWQFDSADDATQRSVARNAVDVMLGRRSSPQQRTDG